MRLVILLLGMALLSGFSSRTIIEKFSTPADQKAAKSYLTDLQAKNFDAIEESLDPSIKTPALRGTLVKMASLLPAGSPTSVKLVGAHTTSMPGVSTKNLTFEYQWGNKWLLWSVETQEKGAIKNITGLNLSPEPKSLEEQTKFTFIGRSPAQYGILIGSVISFSLTLFALVRCVRTKGIRRKWLWILFIIVGFGLLSTNWTTGAINYQLLYFSLFSAGAFAPLYGPWTISMSLPLGALVFLFRRGRLQAD